MKVSIVVTTYNWERALACVLKSISEQTVLPHEVIVADDGSKESTADLLRKIAGNYPVTLKHSWQEDIGYRVASSRNRAIAAASGDYVVLIDGDMMLDRHFIADHVKAAKAGFYVQGSRIVTTAKFDIEKLLSENRHPNFFSSGLLKRRHTFRFPWLANRRLEKSEGATIRGAMSCNQAWWRKDLLAVNGYDERFTGWGREDEDIQFRAYRMGLMRRDMRYAGLATHIYHKSLAPEGPNPNDRWLEDNTQRNLVACEAGIDRHLAYFEQTPLTDLRLRPL